LKVQDDSAGDFGDETNPPHFPIRALDFDPNEQCIYTGDEQGFMLKWDISVLLQKMDSIKQELDKHMKQQGRHHAGKASFLTAVATGGEFEERDVQQVARWKAHKDLINMVSVVPELGVVASCSFDCNVHMWSQSTLQ
jgi:hypothetical protein